MIDLRQIVSGITLSKACSISPDNDAKKEGVTKQVTLKVKFEGVTLQAVFDKAVAGAVIQWANGPGRKGFNKLKAGQVVEIAFSAPGRTTVDPEMAMVALLQSMTPEEQKVKLDELAKKAIHQVISSRE
jgi:hypothetical protein